MRRSIVFPNAVWMKYIVFLTFVLILFDSMVTTASAQNSKETIVAVVNRINGTIEYRERAGGEWKNAVKDQPLYNGNQLRTTYGNRAIIVYISSGTRVLVNENTEIEIITRTPPGEFRKPSVERVRLLVGEVFSEVNKGATPYEVETPSAVASVRGTKFNSMFGDGFSTFFSTESDVEIYNELGKILMREFEMVEVRLEQPPGAAKSITKQDAEKLLDWVRRIEPIWRLNINTRGSGSQSAGNVFGLTIWAQHRRTNILDANAGFTLNTFTSSSDIIEFSTDRGKTWTLSPRVTLVNGQSEIMARSTAEGSAVIIAEAELSEPASLPLTISRPREKRVVELKIARPDGSGEDVLIMELEER